MLGFLQFVKAMETMFNHILLMCLLSFQVLKILQKLKDLDITLDILAVSLLERMYFVLIYLNMDFGLLNVLWLCLHVN